MTNDAKPESPQAVDEEQLKKEEAALRVEQDNRVAQVKTEAERGETSKAGVNPDG